MDRFFYHSFPRPKEGVNTVSKGLEILRSIADCGLVLTPEITEWKERLANGTFSKPWLLIQKRACFTELALNEIVAHSKQFGPFALEFDLKVLRRLGAIPVFYLPRATTREQSLEHLGATLMARIGEVQQLLDRLGDLEREASTSENDDGYIVVQKNGVAPTKTRCTVGGTRDLISILTMDAQPVKALQAAVRAFSGFFYPTEDLNYTTELAYYRQREWRIVGNVMEDNHPLMRELTEKEKCRLLSIDADFFGKVMKFHSADKPRIDECLAYPSYREKSFLQYVRRVIVPSECVSEVDSIVRPIITDDKNIVSIDNLTST